MGPRQLLKTEVPVALLALSGPLAAAAPADEADSWRPEERRELIGEPATIPTLAPTRLAGLLAGASSVAIAALWISALLVTPAPAGAGSEGMVWKEPIEVDSGKGYRGPWRMNESRFLYVDDPTVAVAADGSIGVAWVDQARRDILFQIYRPDGTSLMKNPVDVSRTPRVFSWLPRIVLGAGEPKQVFVLWQEIVFSGGTHGGEAFFARSTDGGRSFERPMNLSNSEAGDGKGRITERVWHNGSLDLARGRDGNLYAAWTEYEGSLWFARSTDDGESFSSPARVAGGDTALPARGPSVATAGDTVYLAWTTGEDRSADLRLAVSRDGGRSFGEARVVAATDGYSDAPKLAVDGDRTVHLAFAERSGGPFAPSHVLYARWREGEPWFERPTPISEPLPTGYEAAGFPSLGLGPGDCVFVVWDLYPGVGSRPRGLGVTRSEDGGASFVEPSVIPGSDDPGLGVNGSQQGKLMERLEISPSGALAVVHSTFDEGEASHVWLFRGSASLSSRPDRPGRSASAPDDGADDGAKTDNELDD